GPKPCKKKTFHHRASAFLFTHDASIATLIVFPFTHEFPKAALAVVVASHHANKEPHYCSLPSATLQSTLTVQRSSLLMKPHCTAQTCSYTAALDELLPPFLCFPQHKLGPDRCLPSIVCEYGGVLYAQKDPSHLIF
ncbi:hypothetical protein L195_g042135, partial [Trifolium pratense]